MKDLAFMAKRNTGGWTLADAAAWRAYFQQTSEAGTKLNCVLQMNDGSYAGVAGFCDINWWNRSAEMGTILHSRVWGKGIATEINYLFLKWAFEEVKLHRIEYKTSVNNSGMNYFCSKVLKAHLDGVLRDWWPNVDCFYFRAPVEGSEATEVPAHGITLENITHESVNLYSILASEWAVCKASLLQQMAKTKAKT
jgi:RimJ/RimL family protein N-acetyltransferase